MRCCRCPMSPKHGPRSRLCSRQAPSRSGARHRGRRAHRRRGPWRVRARAGVLLARTAHRVLPAAVRPADARRLQGLPAEPAGEAVVFEVRRQLVELFLQRGAAHLQIGKTYRYRESLDPAAWALLEAVKRAVDPRGLMNPGRWGCPSAAGASGSRITTTPAFIGRRGRAGVCCAGGPGCPLSCRYRTAGQLQSEETMDLIYAVIMGGIVGWLASMFMNLVRSGTNTNAQMGLVASRQARIVGRKEQEAVGIAGSRWDSGSPGCSASQPPAASRAHAPGRDRRRRPADRDPAENSACSRKAEGRGDGQPNVARPALKRRRGPPSSFQLARPERFELPTSWFVAMHSIQLSYGRVIRKLDWRRERDSNPR
jgi:hypothetical protein